MPARVFNLYPVIAYLSRVSKTGESENAYLRQISVDLIFIKKKMEQILLYPQHYNPLKYELNGYRAAHIDTDYHDKIYNKQFIE